MCLDKGDAASRLPSGGNTAKNPTDVRISSSGVYSGALLTFRCWLCSSVIYLYIFIMSSVITQSALQRGCQRMLLYGLLRVNNVLSIFQLEDPCQQSLNNCYLHYKGLCSPAPSRITQRRIITGDRFQFITLRMQNKIKSGQRTLRSPPLSVCGCVCV